MEQRADVSLLQAMTLLQSVVLSCIDRKEFPFTRTQISIFTVLSLEGELSMKQIARHIASSQEQATRAVAPLADAGYVERRTDPANRTRVYIRLTESGVQLLKAYWEVLKTNLSGKLADSLDEGEQEVLYGAAMEIVRLMEKVKKTEEKKLEEKRQEERKLKAKELQAGKGLQK